jgi:CesT_Tir_1
MGAQERLIFGTVPSPDAEERMRTQKDVEAYLLRSNRHFVAVEDQPGTFLIETGKASPAVAVRVDPPIVVCRVHIADVNGAVTNESLFRRLLQYNAKALVHASYGLDDNRIVLGAALELENLDFNELEAMLEEIDMALAQQVPELLKLSKA